MKIKITTVLVFVLLVSACFCQGKGKKNKKNRKASKTTKVSEAKAYTHPKDPDILQKELGIFHILKYNNYNLKKRLTPAERAAVEKMFKKLEKNFQENRYINGVSPVIFWNWLEPKEDQYEFASLKRIADLCKKYDKGFKLIIIPGIRSPKWVHKHCETITFEEDGKEYVVPVPWDKGFKKHWKELLTEVNRQFSPYENFAAITLAGANHRWAETDMPRTPDAVKQWEKYGDYKKKTADFWKEMVDFYAETFKKQHIAIHIRVPFAGMYKEYVEIIDRGLKKCPDRITLQNCQLTGTDDNFYSQTYSYVHHYRNSLHVGFQSLTSEMGDPERFGNRQLLIYNMINANAAYIEIFPEDGFNKTYIESFYKEWKNAEEMGAIEYKKLIKKQGKYKESGKKRKVNYSELYHQYH